EPVPAPGSGTARRAGPEPDPAGHRPRDPSAAALHRLCRLLDLFELRGGGADVGLHRCGLGPLGTAMGVAELVLPDARYRDGLVLGLLRTALGRLVVLGPGRECELHAMACRHGA